jgi:hypothetical protein
VGSRKSLATKAVKVPNNPIPVMARIIERDFPIGVMGYASPEPVVEIVEKDHHKASTDVFI